MEHCWHSNGAGLGKEFPVICCWCGGKGVETVDYEQPADHGPHLPKLETVWSPVKLATGVPESCPNRPTPVPGQPSHPDALPRPF